MSKKLALWKKEDYPVVDMIAIDRIKIYFLARRCLAVEYSGQFFIFHAFDATNDGGQLYWQFKALEWKLIDLLDDEPDYEVGIGAVFRIAREYNIGSFGVDPGEFQMIINGRKVKKRKYHGI